VYTELGQKPIAITRAKGATARIAGAFVVLAASPDSSGAVVAEDGFSVFIPEDRWAETVNDLQAGHSFEVASRAEDLPFAVVFDPG
jgi:hypothetical protein